jgi:hypothetical protein
LPHASRRSQQSGFLPFQICAVCDAHALKAGLRTSAATAERGQLGHGAGE